MIPVPLRLFILGAIALYLPSSLHAAPKSKTLEDLKMLDIICLVPSWLPEGYHLKKVGIDFSDREGLEDAKAPGYAAYGLEYGNGKKGRFTIESTREGVGDRNLDENERAEEAQFEMPHYGTVYIIYFPPGRKGVKKRIASNWIRDDVLKAEIARGESVGHLGRFHGVSGFGMTVAEFEKIVQSLHPIRERSTEANRTK